MTLCASGNIGPSVHSVRKEKGRSLVGFARYSCAFSVIKDSSCGIKGFKQEASGSAHGSTVSHVSPTDHIRKRARTHRTAKKTTYGEKIVPTDNNTHMVAGPGSCHLRSPQIPLSISTFPPSLPLFAMGVIFKVNNTPLMSGSSW